VRIELCEITYVLTITKLQKLVIDWRKHNWKKTSYYLARMELGQISYKLARTKL